MDDYQRYIHLSRYARFREDLGRRESWEETVDRLCNFWKSQFPKAVGRTEGDGKTTIQEIPKNIEIQRVIDEWLKPAILNHDIMPSMRSMMTAGRALELDNVAGFNCSYLPIETPRDFDELFYILMCGTGVGYSVEAKYVSQLPAIAETFHDSDSTIVVSDSKIGWASSYREILSLLWAGKIPRYDLSRVRPAGAPLRTFGGRASGPKPLDDLFRFTISMFRRAAGRRLTTLEAHDLVCKIADVVVVGGVRRSALIALCDLGDDSLRLAKSGNWWVDHPHRALANISAVYENKPAFNVFLKEWHSLYDSYSGERGIFSREAARRTVERSGRRDEAYDWGTNPCSEIILRPRQFCNLSEVVVRAEDKLNDLRRKVRLAAILGTLQSTLTDFRYLRKEWQRNTEEERLLGVSLTGICDNEVTAGLYLDNIINVEPDYSKNLPVWLKELSQVVIETNKEWAEKLGINLSVATTCVKPSGTVSQLVNSSSGIHPRFAPYYIRSVRADIKDPLAQFMVDKGFPYEPDVMKPEHQLVFYFPQKAPEGSVCVKDVDAMRQLDLWGVYQGNWCEHKPSITVYYRDSEFLELGQKVYNEFDSISGISFLPHSDHSYQQAPYMECTEAEYYAALDKMPKNVDWGEAAAYDKGEDLTTSAKELACVAGVCDLA